MDIVTYLTQEGFLGDDFLGLLHSCTGQGDIDALRIFLEYQSEYFTVFYIYLFFYDFDENYF